MALFTDGAGNDLEDLVAYDSNVLEMARQEGIDLGVKLDLAWEELGIELRRFLILAGRGDLELRNICVTKPLEKCHAFRSLALAYWDAAHRQRSDRFGERAREWERQAAWAWTALLDTGIGIVERPVDKAGRPVVELAPMEMPAATYWVRIAWVDEGGQEGAASEAVIVNVGENQGLVVMPGAAPAGISGWHVYLGFEAEALRRQNSAPIPIGQSWRQSSAGLLEGPRPSEGQAPDYYLRRGGLLFQEGNEGFGIASLLLRG
jgi:hypothetical protein